MFRNIFRYLKGWFAHTSFGESCTDVWSEIKYYKPFLDEDKRAEIWPKFKKAVHEKDKDKLLKKLWLKIALGWIGLICGIFAFGYPLARLLGIVAWLILAIILPLANFWQLREIFHEVDRSLYGKPTATKQSAKPQGTNTQKTAAVGTAANPIQSGITPRRKSLHS